MLSFKKIAGYLKKVGSRDGGNAKDDANNNNNNKSVSTGAGGLSHVSSGYPIGDGVGGGGGGNLSQAQSQGGGTGHPGAHSTAGVPILHGLPQNADTQAVLKHVFGVVSKKSQYVVDEAPWLLLSAQNAVPPQSSLQDVNQSSATFMVSANAHNNNNNNSRSGSAIKSRKPSVQPTTPSKLVSTRDKALENKSYGSPDSPSHFRDAAGSGTGMAGTSSGSARTSPPRFSLPSENSSPHQVPAPAPVPFLHESAQPLPPPPQQALPPSTRSSNAAAAVAAEGSGEDVTRATARALLSPAGESDHAPDGAASSGTFEKNARPQPLLPPTPSAPPAATGRTTPSLIRVLLPTNTSAATHAQGAEAPAKSQVDSNLPSPKINPRYDLSARDASARADPNVNLLESLQKERGEMIEALDVCLQEVPDCDDELELMLHTLDAITHAQQQQMQWQLQQQIQRRNVSRQQQPLSTKASPHGLERRTDTPLSLAHATTITSGGAAATQESASNQRTPLRRPARAALAHKRHPILAGSTSQHADPTKAAKTPGLPAAGEDSAEASGADMSAGGEDDVGDHSTEAEDDEDVKRELGTYGEREDLEEDGRATTELEDELYGDDRSYMVDADGAEDDNDASTIFSYSGPTSAGFAAASGAGIAARLSGFPAVADTFVPPTSHQPYILGRSGYMSPAVANSQVLILRAMATAANNNSSGGTSSSNSNPTMTSSIITLYEWRLLLLRIVELLIGVDRAVYIELSQRAVSFGSRRNAVLQEQLAREAQAAAAAVANAAPDPSETGAASPSLTLRAAPSEEPTASSTNATATATPAAMAAAAADKRPTIVATPANAPTADPSTSTESFTSPRELPGGGTGPGADVMASSGRTAATDGGAADTAASPRQVPGSATPTRVPAAATTPSAFLQASHPPTAAPETTTSRPLSSGAFLSASAGTSPAGMSVRVTPANHDLAPTASAGPQTATDAALLEAAVAAASVSLSPTEIKSRKAVSTATTKAVDDALGAACTLATWVALRAILRQHVAHLEEAAVRFAEAEAAITSASDASSALVNTASFSLGSDRSPSGNAGNGIGITSPGAGAGTDKGAQNSLEATAAATVTEEEDAPADQAAFGVAGPSVTSATKPAAAATPVPWTTYASVPTSIRQRLQPQMRAAAHRALSAEHYPSVTVAWDEVVRELQELLDLPEAHMAACVMCASFLRDDGRELMLCMLQDPQPRSVMDAIQANRRYVQTQETLDFLSSFTSATGGAATGASSSAGGGSGAAAGAGAAATKSAGPQAHSATTSTGGASSSPASSASSVSTTPSSSGSTTPSATKPLKPSPPPGKSLPPAGGSLRPTPLSATNLTAGSNLPEGGNTTTSNPALGNATAAAPEPVSPILSNRTSYGKDVVLDDILRDLERAYRDGVARTWSEYLETAIMVPFLNSIGVVPPTAPESETVDGLNKADTGGRANAGSGEDDMEEELEGVCAKMQRGDGADGEDLADVVMDNVDADTDRDEDTSEAPTAATVTAAPSTNVSTANKEKERRTKERARVAERVQRMLATEEGDVVLCQVATAYFFCSDEWGRAVRQDGFSFLYHHAGQRIAVAKDKEDWAMGKKHTLLAVSLTAQLAAAAPSATTATDTTRRGADGAQLQGLQALSSGSGSGNRLPPWTHTDASLERRSSHVSPSDAALAATGPSDAGENSNFGSLRWSPYILGSNTPVQQSFNGIPALAANPSSQQQQQQQQHQMLSVAQDTHRTTPSNASTSAMLFTALQPNQPTSPLERLKQQHPQPQQQQQQQPALSFRQRLLRLLTQAPASAPRADDFSVDREMVERMLNMSWSAALHKRVEHCIAARPPKLDDALVLAHQERSVAQVYSDFRARQRALSSLVNVCLASGKSREAYQVANKHFKNEKKEWTTQAQTMFTAIRYMQSMVQLVRAQAACHAYGAVIETGQFVLPQATLCEEMLHVLSPKPRGTLVLRFGDARLKLLRARIYLKKEIWRSYAAFDDATRAERYFIEYVHDVCHLRKRMRDGELFDAMMERGAHLLHKAQFVRAVAMFQLAVQLAKGALERASAKHHGSSGSGSNRTKASAAASERCETRPPVGAAAAAVANAANLVSPSPIPSSTSPTFGKAAAPEATASTVATAPTQPLTTVTNANTGVTVPLPSSAPTATTTASGAASNAVFHKDLHLRGAGSGSLTSGEEHGVRSQQEEEDLELPWRVAESERMLALAYVQAAEHEVNVTERRTQLSNAVSNAYASQSSLQRWQAKGGTPKRMLTAVPLSLVVVCRALLQLKQTKKAVLLLEPLIEDKINSAQVRPPMWKELLNPTRDPLTAEDVVLRTYVNSVRLSVYLLYARCLSHVDGDKALRAVDLLGNLIKDSERWMHAVQIQVRAVGRQIQLAKATTTALATSGAMGDIPGASNSLAGLSTYAMPSTTITTATTTTTTIPTTTAGVKPIARGTPLSASITSYHNSSNRHGSGVSGPNPPAASMGGKDSDGVESAGRPSSSLAGSTQGAQVTSVPPLTATPGGEQAGLLHVLPNTTTTGTGRLPEPESVVPGGEASCSSQATSGTTTTTATTNMPATSATVATTSAPSLSPYTIDSSASNGFASAASPGPSGSLNAGNARAPGPGSLRASTPNAAQSETTAAAHEHHDDGNAASGGEDSIRVCMESQSERVTAWRALWQMGVDLRKMNRDMGIVAGDALCLVRRYEEALGSYSNALFLCMSEEEGATGQRSSKAVTQQARNAPGAASVAIAQASRRATVSQSGNVSQPSLSPQLRGSSPNLSAASNTAGAPPPTHALPGATTRGSPMKPFEDTDMAWLEEPDEDLDTAIADMHSPMTSAALHDLRTVVAAAVRKDYKAAENRVLSKLADVYKSLKKPEMSIHYLKLVLEYAVENQDALLEYNAMLQLARLYTSTGSDAEAQDMWEKVSALAKQYEDKEVTRETLRNMISGQLAAGIFPTVVETAKELNKLAKDAEGADAAADNRFALEALATAHLQLAHYAECLEALDAREKVQERSGEWNGKLLELRARARLGMGENASAVKVLLTWVSKARQMRNPVELSHANVVLASAYASEGAIYKARRCHLAALRALSMIRAPLTTESKERVLESARWLVHYYYLNTDEVQVDPELKDTRPAGSPKLGAGKGGMSMFMNNSSSSFEHDLHNNSGDLAEILEEDFRMRAERAAAAASAEDEDEDDMFSSFVSGASFSGFDRNAMFPDEREEKPKKSSSNEETTPARDAEEAAKEKEKEATSMEKSTGTTASDAAPTGAEASHTEAGETSEASPVTTRAPEKPATKTITAPPPINSTRPLPPPTTLANVSICSRPAAAAAGTDVLETITHGDIAPTGSGTGGDSSAGSSPTPGPSSTFTTSNAGTGTANAATSRAPATSGAAKDKAANAPPPLPLPDELNYQSPATVSTLCYNSAIETMEWTMKLLFQNQVMLAASALPHTLTGTSAAGTTTHGSTKPNDGAAANHGSNNHASGGGNANSSTNEALVEQQYIQMLSDSCTIPYSPAEAVDFALLAFPRCTFVFYFAEYATSSSSCYDVVIRPANHNSFIHRSAQVTTLKNYHDRNVLQRVAAGPVDKKKSSNGAGMHSLSGGTSTGVSSADNINFPPAAKENPMLAGGAFGQHPFGVGSNAQQQHQQQHQQQQLLAGKALEKALSDDTILRFQDLHDELWTPVVSGLKRARIALEDAECLIIMADTTLMNAPFVALLPNPDDCMPGDSQEPLGLQIPTVVTPSLSHLVYRGLHRKSTHNTRSRIVGHSMYGGGHRNRFMPLSFEHGNTTAQRSGNVVAALASLEEASLSPPGTGGTRRVRGRGLRLRHRHHHRHHRHVRSDDDTRAEVPMPFCTPRPESPRVVNTIFLSEEDEDADATVASIPVSPPATGAAGKKGAPALRDGISRQSTAATTATGGQENPTVDPFDIAASEAEEGRRTPEDPFEVLRRSGEVHDRRDSDGSSDYSDDESESTDGSSRSSASSRYSTDDPHEYEPQTNRVEMGSDRYDCSGCGDASHDGEDGNTTNANNDADCSSCNNPPNTGAVNAVEQMQSSISAKIHAHARTETSPYHHRHKEDNDDDDDGNDPNRKRRGDATVRDDDGGILGAAWNIHTGCTRKAFIRGFCDPASRIVMVLSKPINGMIHVADGFVGMKDLKEYYQEHALLRRGSNHGATSSQASPSRIRQAVSGGSLSGVASPRRNSTSVSLAGSSAAVHSTNEGAAQGASTGAVAKNSQSTHSFTPAPSLSHLELFVSAVDRGKTPIPTALVSTASACLELGCPRVLRVDMISGTHITREHKAFLVLYLENLERVLRWRMAFPYALALRMTLDTAIHERKWPATVWGAFTLVGTP